MTKFNIAALALTILSLTGCGKSAAEQAVEAINLTPVPVVNPGMPTPPRAVLWNGTGLIKRPGTSEMACDKVAVEILEDASSFELRKFDYDCSGMTAQMDAIRLELRGTELFLGANKVGEKRGNLVDFTLNDPSGASLGFRFLNEGGVLQTVHTMKANGFEQTLTASLKQ